MPEELQYPARGLQLVPKLNWYLDSGPLSHSIAILKPRNLSPSPQVTSFKGQPHLLSLILEPPDPALAPSSLAGSLYGNLPFLHTGITSSASLPLLPPQTFHNSMNSGHHQALGLRHQSTEHPGCGAARPTAPIGPYHGDVSEDPTFQNPEDTPKRLLPYASWGEHPLLSLKPAGSLGLHAQKKMQVTYHRT